MRPPLIRFGAADDHTTAEVALNHENQRTTGGEATLEGTGVHSGESATVRIRPAPPDSGIVFRRVDLDGEPEIPADLDHVVGTELCTALGEGDTRILTVEHLLAAVSAHGITNAVVELDGPEAPIRDGSFLDYLNALDEAGVVEQEAPARIIEVETPVSVAVDGGASYVAAPADHLRISATIDYDHPAIGRHFGSFDLDTTERFRSEVAPARTFGFKADAEKFWELGMARASSLENTVILDEEVVLNEELRFPDEFLRHKVGDVLGDLALLGARLRGHIVAERPSHKGNVKLARALADHPLKASSRPVVDIEQIMEYLPHRFPMLLVDRIIGIEEGKRIVGVKNVSINEPFFQGHYPGHPVMPGVLIIEAMAQVGGLLLMDVVENPDEKVVYFMTLDNVKWRRPVTPGDQILFELEMLKLRGRVCKLRGTGTVDGEVVAEAELMAQIRDR